MPKIVTKPKWTPPEPSHPISLLVPGSTEASKLREQARAKLTAADIQLHDERLGIQCRFDEARKRYPVLTPDFIVADTKGRPGPDRNELLADAGWRVVPVIAVR